MNIVISYILQDLEMAWLKMKSMERCQEDQKQICSEDLKLKRHIRHIRHIKLEITMYGLWSCIILWLYSNTIIKERVCRGKKVNLEFLLSLKICLSELSHTESLLVITVNIIQENSSIGCLWPKDKDWKSTQNKLKIHLTLYLNADYSSQWDRTHFDVSQSTAFSSILLKWQTDENQLTSFDFSTPASISSSFWITEIIPLGTLIALSHNH